MAAVAVSDAVDILELESDTVTVTAVFFRRNRGNYRGSGKIFKQIRGMTAVTGSVCAQYRWNGNITYGNTAVTVRQPSADAVDSG